jgi:hypothetical protein
MSGNLDEAVAAVSTILAKPASVMVRLVARPVPPTHRPRRRYPFCSSRGEDAFEDGDAGLGCPGRSRQYASWGAHVVQRAVPADGGRSSSTPVSSAWATSRRFARRAAAPVPAARV